MRTNFSKVEKSLEDGLLKLTRKQLLSQADQAAHAKSEESLPAAEFRPAIFQTLERELKKISKLDELAYKKIGFRRQDLKKLIADPSLLTPQDWEKIKEVKVRIENYKRDLQAKLPASTDKQIIENERVKQSQARLNVNSKWIPLT